MTAAAGRRTAVAVSAWQAAVDVAAARDDLITLGWEEPSVRTIARVLKMSTGRAGDLLKIHRSFSTNVIECIGALDAADSSGGESINEIGYRCLTRLSFRALRRLSSLPWRKRVFQARRLVQSKHIPATPKAPTLPDGDRQPVVGG